MNFTLKLRWRILLGFIFLSTTCYNALAKIDPELKFIENKNQWPTGINFGARIPGGNMFVQPGRFSYFLRDEKTLEEIHERTHKRLNESDGSRVFDLNIKNHFVQVNFIGANLNSIATPFGKLSTYYNYYLGSNSDTWASEANSYSGIYYQQFYKGIDVKIYSIGKNLKYDYIVAPYADPSQIMVEYEGADNLYLDNGNLMVKTSLGDLIEKRPFAFQFINGKKVEVRCEYLLTNGVITFNFPDGFDACYELTIDPLLIFSTFSGSTADNWGSTATPGENGTLYSAGVTNESVDSGGGKFPSTPGSFQTAYGGQYDIGILKYDSLGKNLLYATYLGGSESESPHSLIMNADEELVLLGTTSSSNFPTTPGAIDRSFNGGTPVSHVLNFDHGSDLFVARIKQDGTALLSSTFLGGDKNDGLNSGPLVKNYGDELRGDVVTDDDKNIYISTVTASDNFPVTKGLDTLYNGGGTDALLIKLNQDLSKIIWATYIGGSGIDAAHTLKLDSDRNIFLAGGTNSTDFPKQVGSYQSAITGLEDGWIAQIKNSGDEILHVTFTGTSEFDQVYFLDIDNVGGVYVYGQTAGAFPITAGTYPDSKPNSGQFVQKLNTDLTTLAFSTVFGSGNGKPDISPTAFMINECNNLYMCGWGGEVNDDYWGTSTNGMLTSEDAYQKTTSGSDFYFIVLTADASQFLYGSYMGGTKSRTHVDGGTSRFSKDGIVYHAVCSGCQAYNASGHPTSDFPTTAGAWSNSNNSKNCNNAAFKFDLSSLKARLQSNTVALDMPGYNKICIPDKIVLQNKCIGGESFEWDLGDGTTITKTDTSAIIHEYLNEGTYVVKLKAIDLKTCIGVDYASTTVYVYKKKTTIQDDDALCFGTPYVIKADGAAFYDWTTKDASFEAHDNLNEHLVNPEDTTMYYVTINEDGGCIRKDSVQLNVIPNVDVNFNWNRITDCFSRPRLEVTNSTKLWDTDIAVFDFGDGQTTDVDHIVYDYQQDNTYHVKLTVAREFCTFEKSLDFNAFVIKSPNVITPGTKDGNNDFFTIQYGEVAGKTPKDFGINVSLLIYNRWGKLVYQSDDYNNDWNGEGLAAGVYFYEATIDGQALCKDWVHLVK
jgi:hypothetical protein